MTNTILDSEIEVINLGVKDFDESNKMQNVKSVHIDWKPPAGGNVKLLQILDRVKEIM